jgi:hypothetical protein
MITTDFKSDLLFLHNKLKQREHFSFGKFADGEYKVLRNIPITNCDGWSYNPPRHNIEYQYLINAYHYNHKDYYVGISCPCCQPQEDIDWMRENVGVDKSNLTWANIFVNSNYDTFKELFFPEFNSWEGDVILIANGKMKVETLSFKVDYFLPIEIGAWFNPTLQHIINEMKVKAVESDNQLFLFSGGPLGNILAHQLHLVNKNNTYIDIGSTVNPWGTNHSRDYFVNNNPYRQKVCTW